MNLLYDRRIGAAAMAVMILLAALLGSHRSLARLAEAPMEAYLHGGEENFGVGIQDDLNDRVEYASNLLTIAGRYFSEGDETVRRTEEAVNALREAEGPGEQSEANRELTDAAAELYSALEETSLKDKDRTLAERQYALMKSRNDTIRHNSYNDLAEEFNEEVLGRFPASILGPLTGIHELELFR